jgi:CBS domain-containing protein
LKNDPSKIPVRNIMTKDVEMISLDHTILDAAKIMHKDNVSSIVAMKNNEPVGIMTERDFISAISHHYPPSTKISQVMISPVIHVIPKESALEASNIMVKKKIRKIPIFDAGKIVGIVSATDILRYFRFSLLEQSKNKCPLHTDEELVKIELSDGTHRSYCYKCEEFFKFDE